MRLTNCVLLTVAAMMVAVDASQRRGNTQRDANNQVGTGIPPGKMLLQQLKNLTLSELAELQTQNGDDREYIKTIEAAISLRKKIDVAKQITDAIKDAKLSKDFKIKVSLDGKVEISDLKPVIAAVEDIRHTAAHLGPLHEALSKAPEGNDFADLKELKAAVKKRLDGILLHRLSTLTDKIDAEDDTEKRMKPLKGFLEKGLAETVAVFLEAAKLDPDAIKAFRKPRRDEDLERKLEKKEEKKEPSIMNVAQPEPAEVAQEAKLESTCRDFDEVWLGVLDKYFKNFVEAVNMLLLQHGEKDLLEELLFIDKLSIIYPKVKNSFESGFKTILLWLGDFTARNADTAIETFAHLKEQAKNFKNTAFKDIYNEFIESHGAKMPRLANTKILNDMKMQISIDHFNSLATQIPIVESMVGVITNVEEVKSLVEPYLSFVKDKKKFKTENQDLLKAAKALKDAGGSLKKKLPKLEENARKNAAEAEKYTTEAEASVQKFLDEKTSVVDKVAIVRSLMQKLSTLAQAKIKTVDDVVKYEERFRIYAYAVEKIRKAREEIHDQNEIQFWSQTMSELEEARRKFNDYIATELKAIRQQEAGKMRKLSADLLTIKLKGIQDQASHVVDYAAKLKGDTLELLQQKINGCEEQSHAINQEWDKASTECREAGFGAKLGEACEKTVDTMNQTIEKLHNIINVANKEVSDIENKVKAVLTDLNSQTPLNCMSLDELLAKADQDLKILSDSIAPVKFALPEVKSEATSTADRCRRSIADFKGKIEQGFEAKQGGLEKGVTTTTGILMEKLLRVRGSVPVPDKPYLNSLVIAWLTRAQISSDSAYNNAVTDFKSYLNWLGTDAVDPKRALTCLSAMAVDVATKQTEEQPIRLDL